MWDLVESGCQSAAEIMEKDRQLLENLSPDGNPTLHLYDWKGASATYGYFIDPADHFHLDVLETYGLSLARRPTGGGIIFHLYDLAFSVLIPARHPGYSLNTLDNYALINRTVIEAIKNFSQGSLLPALHHENCCGSKFCMSKPTRYDLVIEGRKAGGAAQRKTRAGFLHQGSLCLSVPKADFFAPLLKNSEETILQIQENSFSLFPHDPDTPLYLDEKGRLKHHLIEALTRL